MIHPSYTLLYVDSPPASRLFYEALLGCAPVEASETFTLFVLESGLKLGFWSRHTAEPTPAAGPGGVEVGFRVEDPALVDTTHAEWQARGLTIQQAPTDLDFGRTFVALDPDGHRLRVFNVARD